MKKLLLILIPLLILIGGTIYYVVFIKYDPYIVPDEVSINLNDNVFDVYTKHKAQELVKDSTVDFSNEEVELKSNTLGEYTYTMEYTYNKRKYKYVIPYQVKDLTKPVLISAPSTLEIAYDDKKDICDKISYGDIYDSTPKCEIIGVYDKTKIGTYNDLEYVITDEAGNEERRKFTLKVVYKKEISYYNPTPLYIDDVINNYKNENTSIGIDVSKWQGNVDFKKVKDAGIEFVIMRIGSWRDKNESIDMDVKFKEYYQAVKEVGLKVGVYVYNVASSPEDGKKVAKWVIDNLNGDKLDYPIAYDWEDWANFNSYGISLHTLIESYKAFNSELKDNGYTGMLYSSKYYLENVWPEYQDELIWLAHYTNRTDFKGEYIMWQMSSGGKVKGITENTVDIDILYKNKLS